MDFDPFINEYSSITAILIVVEILLLATAIFSTQRSKKTLWIIWGLWVIWNTFGWAIGIAAGMAISTFSKDSARYFL